MVTFDISVYDIDVFTHFSDVVIFLGGGGGVMGCTIAVSIQLLFVCCCFFLRGVFCLFVVVFFNA